MSDIFDMFGEKPLAPVAVALPEDPRERFRELLLRLKVAKSTAAFEKVQQDFDAEIADRMSSTPKKKGKKKPLPIEVLGAEVYEEIRSKYEAIVEDIGKTRREAIDRLKDQLADTPDQVQVSPGEEWQKVDEVWSSTYSTQGWGAHAYARDAAEIRAVHYQGAGLNAEVRPHKVRDDHPGDKFWERSDLTVYQVWVQASEEDCEIAKHKPGLSLKDWLQWCRDHQRNPRVYVPGLPWGLEEKLGVVGSKTLPPS